MNKIVSAGMTRDGMLIQFVVKDNDIEDEESVVHPRITPYIAPNDEEDIYPQSLGAVCASEGWLTPG